jgi:hypothetical protein
MNESIEQMQNCLAELTQQLAKQEALLATAIAFDLGQGLIVSRCTVMPGHWVIIWQDWQIWDHQAQQWRYIPARSHHWTTDFLAATRFETRQMALAQAEELRTIGL